MELPYDKCLRELQELLQAQYPLIFLRSAEESRAINCAIAAHQALISKFNIKDGELARWSSIDGFRRLVSEDSWESTGSASEPNQDLRTENPKPGSPLAHARCYKSAERFPSHWLPLKRGES
jgi:hypothetical protein